ncbi:hypothetical protein [Amycolatopsis sp. H20-H5]|uniref:hypothetical protein n=1 Tax=Amycolatopsis sp. H20-H5 TaxID=3046309 RepID=UPI002DBFAEEA|nr:hypothetical protein [Amycolatopsis sp. H20-H5]MEC3975538.1 hypothetical protein [Amycolatopsis sp. H20-H5]
MNFVRTESPAEHHVPNEPASRTAGRVVVVSLQRSGTHLLKEAMTALGYSLIGRLGRQPGKFVENPAFTRRIERKLLRAVYPEDELSNPVDSRDETLIERTTAQAGDALLESWKIHLGLRERPSAVTDDSLTALTTHALTSDAAHRFRDTPAGLCWFLPELALNRVDRVFLDEWIETGEPRIVFNYRDPRDMVLSMVNFLATHRRADLVELPIHQAYAELLQKIPTTAERLAFALRDSSFPGIDGLERALWLRYHPKVCALSFEDLVGSAGGGSEVAQLAGVTRLVEFLGTDINPSVVASRLFNPRSFTFHRGQTGSWRKEFTADHEKLFSERYGNLAALYGYR